MRRAQAAVGGAALLDLLGLGQVLEAADLDVLLEIDHVDHIAIRIRCDDPRVVGRAANPAA